jgi:trehalose-6-phosphate synthase
MDNLKLKYISEKEGNHYFEITNPDEFIKKHKYEDGSEGYFPMFRSRDGGDFLLKVKSKYVGDAKFDTEDKEKIYDTAVSLKDYRMQTKDKKLRYGKYCQSLLKFFLHCLSDKEQLHNLHIGTILLIVWYKLLSDL